MKFVKAFRRPRSLQGELHRHLAGYREARSHEWVHASELMHKRAFCPREFALMDVTKKKRRGEFIPTALAVVFETSTVAQDVITKWCAEIGIARGDWRCVACQKHNGFGPRPAKCFACASTNFEYLESQFISEYSGVSGSVDLLIDLGEPKLRLVEIKAVQPTDFKVLKGPLAEHRWRTNLYLRLVEESVHRYRSLINTDEGWVVYMAKGGYGLKAPQLKKWGIGDGPFSPFLEFKIERDDDATDEYVDMARQLHVFRRESGVFPKGICATMMKSRAKACPVVDECFSGKYPAGD